MKKVLFLLLLALLSCGGNKQDSPNDKKAYNILNELRYDEVYVCKGKYSKRFHNDMDCKGLMNCRGGIEIMTIEEAEDLGKTPCGYCYK